MPTLEKQGAVAPEVVRALVGALHPDPVARPTPTVLANQLRSFGLEAQLDGTWEELREFLSNQGY